MIGKLLTALSVLAILLGVIGWIFTLSVDPYTSKFATAWQITWVANPIGLLLSIYLLFKKVKFSLLLVILNAIMIFSFMPMWFLGDLFNYIFQRS